MNQRSVHHVVAPVLTTLVVILAGVVFAIAQDTSETGSYGGAGGSGGAGGYGGGAGAGGGGGGGGGGGVAATGGGIAAHGEYVYVTKYGQLYQYAAYDLKLIKTIDLNKIRNKGRNRERQANKQTTSAGRSGRNGQDGEGGNGGAGGFGGGGGLGGGFAYWSGGFDRTEDVAAFGDFVYVLHGDRLHKLDAETLTTLKTVRIKREL